MELWKVSEDTEHRMQCCRFERMMMVCDDTEGTGWSIALRYVTSQVFVKVRDFFLEMDIIEVRYLQRRVDRMRSRRKEARDWIVRRVWNRRRSHFQDLR